MKEKFKTLYLRLQRLHYRPAPNLNIKTQQPFAIADSSSDSTLLHHSEAVVAQLNIEPTLHPLQVRFPYGKTARSMGTSEVVLPETTIAHIFEDHVLGQSLFSISDISKQDYSATFHKNGLYIYHNNDLVHFCPKTTTAATATAWTLPIQRPLEHANAVISLSSDKKFVEFTNASLGIPVQSTLLRAVRKGYLSTMPRLTSELLCKHPSNTAATTMGHLDRTRQGLDSTKSVPALPAQPLDTYVCIHTLRINTYKR